MKLWAYHPRASGGFHWTLEREVTPETAEQWLSVFAKDEPLVKFVIAKSKPK